MQKSELQLLLSISRVEKYDYLEEEENLWQNEKKENPDTKFSGNASSQQCGDLSLKNSLFLR